MFLWVIWRDSSLPSSIFAWFLKAALSDWKGFMWATIWNYSLFCNAVPILHWFTFMTNIYRLSSQWDNASVFIICLLLFLHNIGLFKIDIKRQCPLLILLKEQDKKETRKFVRIMRYITEEENWLCLHISWLLQHTAGLYFQSDWEEVTESRTTNGFRDWVKLPLEACSIHSLTGS